MNHLAVSLSLLVLLVAPLAHAMDHLDIETVPQDLTTPAVTVGEPGPGKRVKQVNKDYAGSEVYHALYLPTDWEKGKKYPVIVEYAGNKWRTSPGTVDGSNLGYGISGGKGVIWVCVPFVDAKNRKNATTWWGDVEATVDYCKKAVERVCAEYGGDKSAVFLAGFSRGAIACNYIGLHDDEIAALWCGFICHSHYDGVHEWPYAASDRTAAARRLKRLGDRPQFISHERSVAATANYLKEACPAGNFTFQAMSFANHTDTWVLRDIPERRAVRQWFRNVLNQFSHTPWHKNRGQITASSRVSFRPRGALEYSHNTWIRFWGAGHRRACRSLDKAPPIVQTQSLHFQETLSAVAGHDRAQL